MARSSIATFLAVVTLALLAVSAAALPVATFGENVFRLRVPPGESVRVSIVGRASRWTVPGPAADYFVVSLREPVDFGPGCRLQQATINSIGEPLELWCALDPSSTASAPLRYRFSFADGNDYGGGGGGGELLDVRGVVYAGAGDDIASGNHVFGGAGADILDGPRLYGGTGDDWMNGTGVAQKQVLRGGPGDDRMNDALHVGSSWVYGDRGDDHVYSSYDSDMIVGGPGHDVVVLTEDGKPDVVRLRGGGADVLRCRDPDFSLLLGERHDVVFADSTDRIDPFCKRTRILLEGRPLARPRPG